jgi:ABC-2 type transport system ATP-binding protein
VLLLDEPASGLDPHARIELREMLRGLSRAGRTVLISSHILAEMTDFCTSLGIMERGRMVVSGTIDAIVAHLAPGRTLAVQLAVPPGDDAEAARARAAEILARDARVKETRPEGGAGLTVRFEGSDEAMADLLAALVAAGVRVKTFHERRMDVEDIFRQIGAKGVS